MASRLRGAFLLAVAAAVVAAGEPAFAAWVNSGSGSATAKAGTWTALQLRWTDPTGTACDNKNACSLSIGNGGAFTTTVQVTDSTGNVVSNVGSGVTVTVSISQNQSNGKFTDPTPAGTTARTLSLPATGQAVTTASFTYTAGSGTWTDKLAATSANFTGATATLTK